MTFVSHAQWYEDFMLWRALGDVREGFYVDVGANDPDLHSVSKAFHQRGWRGIDIEPLPHLARRLATARPGNLVVEAAVGAVPGRAEIFAFEPPAEGITTFDRAAAERQRRDLGFDFTPRDVAVTTLDTVLAEAAPEEIHWLKIDVEGFEGEVLKGLDLTRWRPWILVVEATAPNSEELTHREWDEGIRSAGYDFVWFDGLNRFYVAQEHGDLASAFASPPTVFDDMRRAEDLRREQDHARLVAAEAGADDSDLRTAQALAADREGWAAERQAWIAERQKWTAAAAERTAELQVLLSELRVARERPRWRREMSEANRALRRGMTRLAAQFRPDRTVEPPGRSPAHAAARELYHAVRTPLLARSRKRRGLSPPARSARTKDGGSHRRGALVAGLSGYGQGLDLARSPDLGGRLDRPVGREGGPRLDADRGMDRAAWERFVSAAIAAHEARTPANAGANAGAKGGAKGGAGDGAALRLVSFDGGAGQESAAPPNPAVDDGDDAGGGGSEASGTPWPIGDGGIAAALHGLEARDWAGFVQDGDRVHAAAARVLASPALAQADLALPDVAYVDASRAWPHLAPGANYLQALNADNLPLRFFARAGAIRAACDAGAGTPRQVALSLLAADYDGRAGPEEGAVAIGLPLVEIAAGDDSARAARRAAQDRVATEASAVLPLGGGRVERSTDIDIAGLGGITVVICTRDKGFYMRQLVSHLLAQPSEIVAGVVIVSNGTANAHALEALRALGSQPRVTHVSHDLPFHFSAQANLGAHHATGALLLFLNDDIVPIGPRWLEELAAPFANPRTGATGPLLLYPDERVQHAGMYLGRGGVAGHALSGARLPDEDDGVLASAPRFVSCVTGAAMMVRRGDFERLGGFDLALRYWIQDVDLCLRLGAAGRDIVYTPRAMLFHMESLSVADMLDRPDVTAARTRELAHFRRRWDGRLGTDPFHAILYDPEDVGLHNLRHDPPWPP